MTDAKCIRHPSVIRHRLVIRGKPGHILGMARRGVDINISSNIRHYSARWVPMVTKCHLLWLVP